MLINEHKWQYSSTNEYCIHCGLIFESDLGWTSADNIKCKDRKIEDPADLPVHVRQYMAFRGFIFNRVTKKITKPYDPTINYTLSELVAITPKINI